MSTNTTNSTQAKSTETNTVARLETLTYYDGARSTLIEGEELDDLRGVPTPERTWTWSEIPVSLSMLASLQGMGLIESTEEDNREWRSTDELMDNLERIGISGEYQSDLTEFGL